MNMQELFESQAAWTPTDREIGRFMYGGCWALALAVHKRTGLPMAALQEKDVYSSVYGTGQDVIQHVMIALGQNRYLDINGISSKVEIVQRLQDDHDIDASGWHVIPADLEYLRAVARERNDDGDKVLAPLSWYPEAATVARRLIASFKHEIEAARLSPSCPVSTRLKEPPMFAPPKRTEYFPGFRQLPSGADVYVHDTGWVLRGHGNRYSLQYPAAQYPDENEKFVKGSLSPKAAQQAIIAAQADGRYAEHWQQQPIL